MNGGNVGPFGGVGADALGAAAAGAAAAGAPVAVTARRDSRTTPHYADEFHVYHKPKMNGNGTSKRASCNHCNGDWAYNETRLKNHIIDPYRGCRKIPQHVRERIRNAHSRATQVTGATGGGGGGGLAVAPPSAPALNVGACVPIPVPVAVATAPGPVQTQAQAQAQAHAVQAAAAAAALSEVPPAKRKREAALDSSTASGGDVDEDRLRLGVEFSMSGGGLLRAQWIAAEIIHEFHDVSHVTLMPRRDVDNLFNIWIGGKVVWSRGGGSHPLPDYVHLSPLIRPHINC